MTDRYDKRLILSNDDELYKKFIENRDLKSIRQYGTGMLKYPTVDEMKRMTRIRHIWKTGDRYYKLAIEHYGSASYWYVIALFNQRPTEADVALGDMIYIPMPLEAILRVLDEEG
jgi:hypothetical protein|tara:strand:- start:5259 stop:5603 length:345 start_codon:yes stop_codon:yes gene_type:complete